MRTTLKLGRTVITANAERELNKMDVFAAMYRHASGDWGDIPLEDRNANAVALCNGLRVLSSYRDRNGVCFWIITEADRSSTTVLLPSDY